MISSGSRGESVSGAGAQPTAGLARVPRFLERMGVPGACRNMQACPGGMLGIMPRESV